MAKNKENLDSIFRQKLENHEVKPSQLAWERLQNQLPEKEKNYRAGYWWAAAAVLVLLAIGALLRNPSQPLPQENLTAEEKQSTPSTVPIEELSPRDFIAEESQIEEQAETRTMPTEPVEKSPEKIESQKANKKELQAPANLIAEVKPIEIEKENRTIEVPEIEITRSLDLSGREIPEMNTELLITEVEESSEPAYKVTIISDGIKEDKNLIADIGKKVDQVGGIIGKVDEGFASLQDAKNNLFTALLTKKEKVTEE